MEHATPVGVCAICADERQWVPATGQAWTTLEELRVAGTSIEIVELEPGLHGVSAAPGVGIGQQSKLLVTAAGSLLWDPIGYLDDSAVERILALGPVNAIAASHPHMFGVSVEWSRRLRGAPVYVNDAEHAICRPPGRRDPPVVGAHPSRSPA